MGKPEAMTEGDVQAALPTLPGWSHHDNHLVADFKFADFRAAMAFIALVAFEADTADHHPEWTNVYNKVGFRLTTHDAGNRVTDKDIKLARYITQAAADMGGIIKGKAAAHAD